MAEDLGAVALNRVRSVVLKDRMSVEPTLMSWGDKADHGCSSYNVVLDKDVLAEVSFIGTTHDDTSCERNDHVTCLQTRGVNHANEVALHGDICGRLHIDAKVLVVVDGVVLEEDVDGGQDVGSLAESVVHC